MSKGSFHRGGQPRGGEDWRSVGIKELKVVRLRSNKTKFPGAYVREWFYELTLRAVDPGQQQGGGHLFLSKRMRVMDLIRKDEEDWSALDGDRSLSTCVVGAQKRGVRGAFVK